ncbi:hypothetical protein CHLNCDRAFT_137064 [Chlorella variabilis]|uniref:Uncharacterized protein n=1 Tax=Chlorella variabilis TaxID=554065 RepID=E1ZLX0_CHLVA|nr:hypothetical protein CHLNCDRAFT_137064 [Chlorella variabilis]EFN53209.1 hypothetical protein CHLNCDRAFT_137064 [Chlorella variabilis]|eukprot:XP_005845311.1 hypothetical protein CHLNCDRAFT_137064 [Chlorella variabilis]
MASNDAAVLATLQAIQAQLAALPAIAADLSDLKTAVAGLDARITSVEVHGLGETPRRPAAAPQQAAVQAEAAPAVGAALPTGHQQDQQPPAAAQADDLLGDAMDLGEGGGSESQPAAPEEAADGPGVEAGTGGSQRGARQEPPTAAAGGAGQAAQPSPRRGRRLHLEPVRAAPPAQQQQQHRGDGEQQQQAETAAPVQEEEALFNSVWKPGVEGYPLAEHEDFVVAARPACRPAHYGRRLPVSLWQRAGMEPPPRAAQQQQQQEQQADGAGEKGAAGRPADWPQDMLINSRDVCLPDRPGARVPDHPSTFAALRRDRRWLRGRVRDVRSHMLRFAALRAEMLADSESDEEAVMAGFGMQQGVVFAEEEAADPELLDVLPPWDPAELEQEVSVEGSAGEEGRQEEDANEVGSAEQPEEQEAAREQVEEEVELLNARRQELLEQLVSALGLDGEAADEAEGMLQAQIRRSLPLLDPECAPRQQQRSAADAVAALEGLAQGLEHQERRWRAKALPALQRDAHAIWQAGRKLNRGGTCGADEWRDDAAMFQASTPSSSGTNHATLYLTLAGGPQWRPLILSRSVTLRRVQQATSNCEGNLEDLLRVLELQRIAALPEQPPLPPSEHAGAAARPSRRGQPQGQHAGGGQTAAAGSRSEGPSSKGGEPGEQDEYEEDGWLVGDDEGGSGMQGSPSDMEEDGAEYGSASEDLPPDACAAEQQEQEEGQRTWNAAGLQPGQTQVLVAPGMQPPPQQQQQEQEPAAGGQERQQPQEGKQPAATELILQATEVALSPGGTAGRAGPADDASSPTTEQPAPTAQRPDSPPPSAVEDAMQLAGGISGGIGAGGGSDTESDVVPPAACLAPGAAATAAAADSHPAAAAATAPEAAGGGGAEGQAAAGTGEEMSPLEDEETADLSHELAGGSEEEAAAEAVEAMADSNEAEEEGVEEAAADDIGLPGRLSELGKGAAVEVMRSNKQGLHWARAHLRLPIREGDSEATLQIVGEGGQVEPFKCSLAHLRPAAPISAAQRAPPEFGAAVPALAFSSIQVGGCYEFNRLSVSDGSGEGATYVPAIVLRKLAKAQEGEEAPVARRVGQRSGGLGPVLERLAAAGDVPSTSKAAAPTRLILSLAWPGCQKEWMLSITEQQLVQADPPLRRTCTWEAKTGSWKVAGSPQPRKSLLMWHALGLPGEQVAWLLGLRSKHSVFHDTLTSTAVRHRLSGADEGGQALAALQRWFRRQKMARQPTLGWARTLQALRLGDRQTAVQAQLAKSAGGQRDFGLHMARSGTAALLFSPAKRPRRRQPARAAATPPGDSTLQRLHEREQRRQAAAGSQEALQLQARRLAEEAVFSAVGDVAAAEGDRKPVPLWPDEPDKGPLVYSKMDKASVLKQHQREGIQFIWDALVTDFLDDSQDLAGGCLLAHHMGLGKTLQTVTFLASFSMVQPEARYLVLVPKVVLFNWVAEFEKWLPRLPPGAPGLSVVVIAEKEDEEEQVQRWHRTPSAVLICTHDKFRDRVLEVRRGPKPKAQSSGNLDALQRQAAAPQPLGPAEGQAQQLQGQASLPRGPLSVAEMLREGASVVCVDEAHVVKSETSKIRKALESVTTKRRLALTGYPLQNNLAEMYAMISWCDPDLIPKEEWLMKFADPIMAGQLPGATLAEIRIMNQRLALLHDIISRMVHRRGEEILKEELPQKREVVLKLALSPSQHKVYRRFIEGTDEARCRSVLADAEKLRMLCDRPSEFKAWLEKVVAEGRAAAAALAAAARGPAPAAAAVAADEFGVDEDFVVELDDDMSRSTSTLGGDAEACPSTTTDGAQEAASGGTGMQPGAAGLGAAVLAAEQMAAAAAPGGATAGGAKAHRLTKFPLALAEELLALVKAAPPGEFDTQRTTKMWALEQLLRWCAAHEEKLVVVGESLEFLREVERLLDRAALRLPGGRLLRWCKIEGSTTDNQRTQYVQDFEGGRYQVFLLSKAGTHGINLVSCRRIVVLEEPWNPVYNLQAIARLFRYGQAHGTFVYRMYFNGAVQYNVYLRNVNKVMLFKRVIDRQSVKRARTIEKEAEKLSAYFYEPDTPDPQACPGLQAHREQQDDPALAALLTADAQQAAAAGGRGGLHIVEVEDHDKNLADDPSQRLTEDEKRKAAKQAHKEWRVGEATGVQTRAARAKMERLRKVYGDLSEDEEEELERPPAQQQQQQQHQQVQVQVQQVVNQQQVQHAYHAQQQQAMAWMMQQQWQQQQQAQQQPRQPAQHLPAQQQHVQQPIQQQQQQLSTFLEVIRQQTRGQLGSAAALPAAATAATPSAVPAAAAASPASGVHGGLARASAGTGAGLTGQKRDREAAEANGPPAAAEGLLPTSEQRQAKQQQQQQQQQGAAPASGGIPGSPSQKRPRLDEMQQQMQPSGPLAQPSAMAPRAEAAPAAAAAPSATGHAASKQPVSRLKSLLKIATRGAAATATLSRSHNSAVVGSGGSGIAHQHAQSQPVEPEAHIEQPKAIAAVPATSPPSAAARARQQHAQQQQQEVAVPRILDRKRSTSTDSLLPLVAGSSAAGRSAKKARQDGPQQQAQRGWRQSPRNKAPAAATLDFVDLTQDDD